MNKMNEKNLDQVLVIIPARGGSKRLPKKNIELLNGKPLIQYSIESAYKSKFVNDIVISTDDEQIIKICKKFKVKIVKRPKELAQDKTPVMKVIKQAIKQVEKTTKNIQDIIVILQPTSPLRNSNDIDKAINKFKKYKRKTVIGVTETSPIEWMYHKNKEKLIPVIKNKILHRSQDAKKTYRANGAIFVIDRKNAFEQNSVYSNETIPYIMPPERSIDIDVKFDFEVAECLMKKMK